MKCASQVDRIYSLYEVEILSTCVTLESVCTPSKPFLIQPSISESKIGKTISNYCGTINKRCNLSGVLITACANVARNLNAVFPSLKDNYLKSVESASPFSKSFTASSIIQRICARILRRCDSQYCWNRTSKSSSILKAMFFIRITIHNLRAFCKKKIQKKLKKLLTNMCFACMIRV